MGTQLDILFVDDEPMLLQSFRRCFRSERDTWNMQFACGGKEGLEALGRQRFDIVVADLRMPGLDGAELLNRAKAMQPHAVRIVLSGYSDMDTAMRTAFVAHQFLAKPCDLENVRAVVRQACRMNELLLSAELRALVGGVSMLASGPSTYLALTRALANPGASIPDIAKIVERDPAVSAKLLQLVNSAFFALPRRVTSVAEATSYLGLATLKNLVLGIDALRLFRQGGMDDSLQRHALLAGELARLIFKDDKRRREEAFAAGLLHAAGLLVPISADQVEIRDRLGHPAVGAYLLNLWGIPFSVVEAVAFQRKPSEVAHEGFGLVDAIHVAAVLAAEHAREAGAKLPAAALDPALTLDLPYLQARGLSEQTLAGWRNARAELAATTAKAA